MAHMRFSGNQLSTPAWLGDFFSERMMKHAPAKLDKAAFQNTLGIDIQLTAGAAQGATSIAVAALTLPKPSVVIIQATGQLLIPRGSFIVFDAVAGKMAVTTADANQGDVSIAVQPLPTALTGAEDAKWNRFNRIYVPAGVLIGRVWSAQGPYTAADPRVHDDIGFMMYDHEDLLLDDDVEILKPNVGTTIKVNYLPFYAAMLADAGIVDPSVAPTLTVAGTDGTLPAGTYSVGYSYGNASGETKISPLRSIAVGATNHIAVASPGAFPTNATYMKIYVSPAPSDINVQAQGTIGAAGAYNALTVGTGKQPATANNTQAGYGRQLAWIREHYSAIIGKD